MGFSGDLIWEVAAEVGNFTEVQGQIPYCPHLSAYGVVGLKIDRCITLIATGMQIYKQIITRIMCAVINTYVYCNLLQPTTGRT